MKIQLEKKFPLNYITGIFLTKHFNHEFPSGRKEIMKIKKDPEFIERCFVFYTNFENKTENEQNYKRLADALDVTICIRADGGILRYGTG